MTDEATFATASWVQRGAIGGAVTYLVEHLQRKMWPEQAIERYGLRWKIETFLLKGAGLLV